MEGEAPFLRWSEAGALVRAIENATERLLMESFLRREDVVRGILSGTISSLDDLDPFAGLAVSQDPDHEDPTQR